MKPVLFLIANYRPLIGGAETQAEGLAQALAAAGQPVEVLTTVVAGSPPREEAGGVVVRRALRILRLPGLWGASHALGTAAFLLGHGGRYRAIVGFGLQAFHNPAAVFWGAATGRPVVLRCESSGETSDLAALAAMRAGRWLRASVGRAAALVALTPVIRAELEAAGFPRGRIVLIPNGVDLHRFAPPATPAGRRAGPLVFVGRLIESKGLLVLIKAFSLLAHERPEVRLLLLGEGPLRARLEQEAAAAGVAERVLMPGNLAGDAVRSALASAAAVIHPSRSEGLSCALLEAMAMACPIVASDLPANRELLREGLEGLLVPPGDARAIAAAAGRLLDDASLAARIGAAARRRAEENYSLEAVAARYLDLLARLDAGRLTV